MKDKEPLEMAVFCQFLGILTLLTTCDMIDAGMKTKLTEPFRAPVVDIEPVPHYLEIRRVEDDSSVPPRIHFTPLEKVVIVATCVLVVAFVISVGEYLAEIAMKLYG